MMYGSFNAAIEATAEKLRLFSHKVDTGHWQGLSTQGRPELVTYEILNHSFSVPMIKHHQKEITLGDYQRDIRPNLPWADDHFEERVCGHPINPGKTWEYWPYNNSASTFLEGGKFNHNYMERFWPKSAGLFAFPTFDVEDYRTVSEDCFGKSSEQIQTRLGIYHPYGDLNDVVNLLVKEPTTRQAYMPVFFPEDTGSVHGGRLPCSIGYHFIQRGGYCHIVYQLRSCDFVRHFRDDIYLTLRLLLWVIEQASERSEYWRMVQPGTFTMHMTSLHLFVNDYRQLFGDHPRAKK